MQYFTRLLFWLGLIIAVTRCAVIQPRPGISSIRVRQDIRHPRSSFSRRSPSLIPIDIERLQGRTGNQDDAIQSSSQIHPQKRTAGDRLNDILERSKAARKAILDDLAVLAGKIKATGSSFFDYIDPSKGNGINNKNWASKNVQKQALRELAREYHETRKITDDIQKKGDELKKLWCYAAEDKFITKSVEKVLVTEQLQAAYEIWADDWGRYSSAARSLIQQTADLINGETTLRISTVNAMNAATSKYYDLYLTALAKIEAAHIAYNALPQDKATWPSE
ncbi:hypothetical protein MMC09_005324 [Bachmanniomyces sp. S44760]|nr:hypothetical protein [Bachmanniomyces sp. S44760]